MPKIAVKGCVYLLLLCVPLHLSAHTNGALPTGEGEGAGLNSLIENDFSELVDLMESEELDTESTEEAGPGKKRQRKSRREKRKRLGKHQNLADRGKVRGGFIQDKRDGLGQALLFIAVPAAAVVSLALLFAKGTNNKNSQADVTTANGSN